MAQATSRKAKTTRVALAETTAIVPVIATTGDNSGMTGHVLPLPEDTRHDIEATLAAIISNERAIEYARQKLAHLLMDRHEQMVASAPANSNAVPFMHDLATSPAAFNTYLDVLVGEFTTAEPGKIATQTSEERNKFVARMRQRLLRALELATNLAFFKTHNADLICEWDSDNARWRIAPQAFVAPNHSAGGALLMEKDGKTLRTSVLLESNETAEYYFVAKGKGQPIAINLSLDHFNYVSRETIKALQNPTVDTSGVEATSARAKRAARQTTAATAENSEAVAQDIAAENSDVPEATAASAQGTRAWAIEQLKKHLIAIEQLLNMDAMANLSWMDMDKPMTNAVTSFTMVVDRMNAKPDGKKAPAKKAA